MRYYELWKLKLILSILCLWINQILILFFYIFVFRYLKMSKDLSANVIKTLKKDYKNKWKIFKKTVKDMEVFLKKSSFYLKWIEFTRNCEFVPIEFGSAGIHNWNKLQNFLWFRSTPDKWWCYMFSHIK